MSTYATYYLFTGDGGICMQLSATNFTGIEHARQWAQETELKLGAILRSLVVEQPIENTQKTGNDNDTQ